MDEYNKLTLTIDPIIKNVMCAGKVGRGITMLSSAPLQLPVLRRLCHHEVSHWPLLIRSLLLECCVPVRGTKTKGQACNDNVAIDMKTRTVQTWSCNVQFVLTLFYWSDSCCKGKLLQQFSSQMHGVGCHVDFIIKNNVVLEIGLGPQTTFLRATSWP